MRIESFGAAHVDAAAALHVEALTGLVSDLGIGAARAFYRGCAESPLAIGFVAVDEGHVSGFVMGAADPAALKRDVVARHPAAVAFAVAVGIFRDPRSLASIVESVRGPGSDAYDPHAAELTYLAVKPSARGNGTGSALLAAFMSALEERGIATVELSADEDNQAANRFYVRHGFVELHRYHEFGRTHVRYRRNTGAARP